MQTYIKVENLKLHVSKRKFPTFKGILKMNACKYYDEMVCVFWHIPAIQIKLKSHIWAFVGLPWQKSGGNGTPLSSY